MLAPVHIRYALAISFIAVYVLLGFIFKLEAVSYLLIGIPLTVIFQLLIVQQPLHKLWLRDQEKFRLNKSGWAVAFCFVAFPIYKMIQLATQDKLTLLNSGYYSAAILGAFGVGYCCSNFTKKQRRTFCSVLGLPW